MPKEHLGSVISMIGEAAEIVVQDDERGRRIKYASANDIRRGCAQRLINAGVSAETLKLVLRHKDFKTTGAFYGAVRAAQSAATELHGKLAGGDKKVELVGGTEDALQLSIVWEITVGFSPSCRRQTADSTLWRAWLRHLFPARC